ncbi:hypothetical protein ACWCP6_15745 [Streptomyces sp. NPDC002004]
MVWHEWDRFKSAAAQQHSVQHSARTQLNRHPVGPGRPGGGTSGGGTGAVGLRISEGPWTRASGVARELCTSMHGGLTELKEAGAGMADGTDGVACAAALGEILSSWESRLTAVRNECERLRGSLARTGRHFGEIDHGVGARVDRVRIGDRHAWAG